MIIRLIGFSWKFIFLKIEARYVLIILDNIYSIYNILESLEYFIYIFIFRTVQSYFKISYKIYKNPV